MASNEKTAEYAITADPSGYTAGMQQAVAASKNAAKEIEGHFNALGDTFGKLTGAIGAVTAILAGGAAFKSAINATKEWGGQVGGLSKALSINVTEATAMNAALRHLGIDQEVVTGAVDKMNKSLVSNSQAYEVLGIKTKDANGAWRTGGELLPELAARLGAITNETQRNIAGQQIFGKGWADAKGILKLTAEEMENGRIKAKELHLEIDPAVVKKYAMAMNDMKLITTSLQVQMGTALIPTLTTLGKFMGEEGPAMAGVFNAALKGIGFVAGSVWITLQDMGDSIGALAAQAAMIATGEFSMAKQIGVMRDEQFAKNDAKLKKFQEDILNPPAMKQATGGGGGDPALDFKEKDGKDSKDTSRMAAWEEKLAIDKDGFEKQQQLAGTMQDYGKARERDFWKQILSTTSMSAVEKIQANRKYLALEHDLRKDGFDSQIAGEKASLENFQHNFDERIAIATRIYADLKSRYGVDSKEAKAALGDINKEQRKFAEQTMATNKVIEEANRNKGLAQVDADQQSATLQLAMHEITAAKMLDLERGFETRRYQIKQNALLAEEAQLTASPDRNPTALAAIHAQIEDLERKHGQALTQINSQSAMQSGAPWLRLADSMQSSFESSIAGMVSGTMTLQKGLQQLWQGILSAFGQFIAKKVVMWATGETAQTGATLLGNTTRVASDWWAATQSVMASAWSAIKTIAIKAWEVAASVYAAIAAIPVVGPFLAPAMAVAAGAAVVGFAGHIASAEGGYDIPRGVNPITQLHEREMVLPAAQADAVRSMADGSAGGSGNLNVTLSGTPMKGGFFMAHQDELLRVMKTIHRNGQR